MKKDYQNLEQYLGDYPDSESFDHARNYTDGIVNTIIERYPYYPSETLHEFINFLKTKSKQSQQMQSTRKEPKSNKQIQRTWKQSQQCLQQRHTIVFHLPFL